MNIRIIKNSEGLTGEVLSNGMILEKKVLRSEYENIKLNKLFIYDLGKNLKEEILPKVKKYDIAAITDLSVNSPNIYFCSCTSPLEKKASISIIRYNYETKECETVYMYEDDITQYNGYKRVKLFIINDLYIIFQNEYLRSNYRDTYEGYLDFDLFLYSIKEARKIDIIDENLANNGISAMVPVSENSCVIKTGFSLLKDKRYQYLEKNETSVEGIAIINPSQLVSDIMLMKKSILFDTMDRTFYTVTIPTVKKQEDYIIYSRVNLENYEEEVIFFNYVTKHATSIINRNVFEEKKLAKYYIIQNTPYILLDGKERPELYNLKKNRADISFEKGEKIVDAVNGVIITTKEKRSLISGKVSYIRVYSYPQLNTLHTEKASYYGCIATNDNTIYLLT